MRRILFLAFALAMYFQSSAFAAVGCDLNDPDRDVKRFFPQMTSYRTQYLSVKTLGGEKLLGSIEQRLGDKFKGLYETIDVPYTLYTVLQGKTVIGFIHGVNQKGKYGGLQVFVVLDPGGTILEQYFQKMTGSYSGKFRDKSFGRQFKGLRLSDFQGYDVVSGKIPKKSVLWKIKNPEPLALDDFRATLRGIKKNLILMDVFVFNRKGGTQ